MKALIIAVALVLSVGCGAFNKAHAQSPLAWPNLPGEDPPPAQARRANIAEQQLPDGPRLVEAPLGPSGLVTVQLVVDTSGLSPLAARLLASSLTDRVRVGGRILSNAEFAQLLAQEGGELDVQVSAGALVGSVTVRKVRMARTLSLMASLIRTREEPTVQGLQRAFRAVSAQRAELESTPAGMLELGIEDATGQRTWPTRQSLGRITPAVAGETAKLLQPRRLTLLVVGDFEPGAGLKALRRLTNGWRSTPSLEPSSQSSRSQALGLECVSLVTPPGAQTAVAVIAPVSVTSDEWYAARVAAAILGAGGAARLNQELRVKQGLTYGAGARLQGPLDQVWFVAQALTRNEAATRTGQEMRKVVESLSQAVAPGEMESVKDLLVGNHALQWTTTRTAANLVSGALIRGQSLEELQSYPQRIKAVRDLEALAVGRRLQHPHLRSVYAGSAASTAQCP